MTVPPNLTSLIATVANAENIPNYGITSVTTNEKGDGFQGEIYFVNVEDKSSNKTLNLVIKVAFESDQMREKLPIRDSFENEINFYNNIYPQLMDFAKITNPPQLLAKCFSTSLEAPSEHLALENLRFKGFEVMNKVQLLTHEHITLVFKSYARYHAYSFALRDQRPKIFEKITRELKPSFVRFCNSSHFKLALKQLLQMVNSSLIAGCDDDVIQVFSEYSSIVDIFMDALTRETTYSAICHGDAWTNNMLFKYDGETPVDVRLIDWQMVKIASPVQDLSYCLYSGASKAEFDRLGEHLKAYHDEFSRTLKNLGSDPEKLFPLKKLQEHWRFYSKFGMLMGLLLIKVKLTYKETAADFTDDEGTEKNVIMEAPYDEQEFSERARALLTHMYQIQALHVKQINT